jgi:transcriptional regulator with PAS, ATPase and Fis domain
MIRDGLFRDDLFYRINTIEIVVPPLRERGEDVVMLAQHFIRQYAAKYGKQAPRLTKKAADHLLSYSWPGNVRELKHTMEKSVILNESGLLHPEEFTGQNREQAGSLQRTTLSLDEIEREGIRRALRRNQGNLSKTARELKIARQTLYNKMQKFGI